MKRIYLFFSLLIIWNHSFACSCGSPSSFCDSHTHFNLTTTCVFVDTFPHGISMKVLHVWNGIENRDTIKVWNLGGPYSMCYDSLEDVGGAIFGNIGDTVIIALPKIDTIKNSWDVIGDYRAPGFTCPLTYQLWVAKNQVNGFISGSPYCNYMHNCIVSYDYDSFMVDFPVKSLSCQTWLNTNDAISEDFFDYFPNPANDKIFIETSERGIVTISNNLGQLVDIVSISNNQTEISTDDLQSSIYFLAFKTERKVATRKLIVQHR